MSILDIRKRYLYFSMFLIIFSVIYEYFSHGVYSIYMIGSFVIPLVFGFIIGRVSSIINVSYYNYGIIMISVGSVLKGVLEIYGTTNRLVYIYLIGGICLVIIGVIKYFIVKES